MLLINSGLNPQIISCIFLPVPTGTVDLVMTNCLFPFFKNLEISLTTLNTNFKSASPSPLLELGVPTAINIILASLILLILLLNKRYFDLAFFFTKSESPGS